MELYWPPGQFKQSTFPTSFTYLPTSHKVQAAEPSSDACRPTEQLVHACAALVEYFPPEHALHEVEATIELKVPAAHDTHADAAEEL